MSDYDYPFQIRPLSKEEGEGYLIEFPDLPGCMSDGKTVEEALANGREAMLSWIEVATEKGRAIPRPQSPSNQYSGQWRLRVPKSLHAALSRLAKQENVSLNTLAATLLAEGLGRRQPG